MTEELNRPSEGTLSALWTEDFNSVGRHTISVYEQNYDDASSYWMQTMIVDILDPCILTNITTPDATFEVTFKEDTS